MTAPKKPTFADLVAGTPYEGKTEQQVKSALYEVALQDLRNEHLEEFQQKVAASYEAYGLVYKRRLTEAEKAEQQVRALLAANPGLAEKVADVFPQGEVVEVDDTATPAEKHRTV